MRIFVYYEGIRMKIDIGMQGTVAAVKELVREHFSIGPDQGPSGIEGNLKKVLALSYLGNILNDRWVLADIGVHEAGILKAFIKDEVEPVFFLYTTFNKETLPIVAKINMQKWTVGDLRAIATRQSGIPVGVFRLMNREGVEMYDCHTLDEYGLRIQDTVYMETWDGWNEFLYLATKGVTHHVMEHLSSNESVQRYQMKVALYIAAHFGHVDLAVTLMRPGSKYSHIRQDIRAEEAIGDHPERMWCHANDQIHIDSLKAPVHEAAEFGQLGVLHHFVANNVCVVLARDGNGLTALNLALRHKRKLCASFLLTKQWSKVPLVHLPKVSVPLNIYTKMKQWADSAKDKVLIIHGQGKSSVKQAKRHVQHGALLGHGVLVDGFSKSKMTSKPSYTALREQEQEEALNTQRRAAYEEVWRQHGGTDPELYFNRLQEMTFKLPNVNKWNQVYRKTAHAGVKQEDSASRSSESVDTTSASSRDSPAKNNKMYDSDSTVADPLKLPPILERRNRDKNVKELSLSHQNLTSLGNLDATRATSSSTFFQTGQDKLGELNIPIHDLNNKGKHDDHMRKKHKKKEAMVIAKNNEAGMALPLVSQDRTPRPFFLATRNDPIKRTLREYKHYRGLKSRDYAIKCLSIASGFKDKSWLYQVRQAMVIASNSVRKGTQRSLVFEDESSISSSSSDLSGELSSRESAILST